MNTTNNGRNARIRREYEAGTYTVRALATRYNMSASRVHAIITHDRLRKRERPAHDATILVYFVQVGAFVKIGVASDLARRMEQLRAGCPSDITLLGTMLGGRELEAELHRRFARSLHRHEWFHARPAIVKYIQTHATLAPSGGTASPRER